MPILLKIKENFSDFVHKNKLHFGVVLFYLIFREKARDIIDTLLVSPIMSSVIDSQWYLDLIFIFTIIVSFLIILYIIWYNIRPSKTTVGWVITVSIVYAFERFTEDRFHYTRFKNGDFPDIAYADIIFFVLLFTIAYFISNFIRNWLDDKSEVAQKHGFFTDFPCDSLKEYDDLYDRLPFIQKLKQRILATNSTDGAFGIGIIGRWGSGKTSFLNKLKKLIEQEDNVIQLWFNPWLINSPEKIVEVFFSDLISKLSFYDKNLESKLSDYSKELLKSVNYNNLNISAFFSNSESSSITEQSANISKSIKRLRKKIIIYIDDVDRLDKWESLEVLKLVRNTANFSNTFFLVAFDRQYLLSNVRDALSRNADNFLEKIFQIEYYLPIVTNKKIASREVGEFLKDFIKDKQKNVYTKIWGEKSETIYSNEILPIIDNNLNNLRDVNRFLNVFTSHYLDLKSDIYLPDYLKLCILRLKFPEVYYELYYRRSKYLAVTETRNILPEEKRTYELISFENSTDKSTQTNLYRDLEKNPTKYSITQDSLEQVTELVESIFNVADNSHTISRELPFRHQSVIYPINFGKYFDLYLQNRLNQPDFDAALAGEDVDFFNFIDETVKKKHTSDLVQCLENESPIDKAQFERLIRGIFYYSTMKIEKDEKRSEIRFKAIASQFGGEAITSNKRIEEFYADDTAAFKEFFHNIFHQQVKLNSQTFGWQFFNYYSWNHYDLPDRNLVLSKPDFRSWCRKEFSKLLEFETTFSKELAIGFHAIIDTYPFDNLKDVLEIGDVHELYSTISAVKRLINTSSFILFLESNIIVSYALRAKLHPSFQLIYKSKLEIQDEVEKFNIDSEKVVEFLKFYDEAIKVNELNWIRKFEFTHLQPFIEDTDS